MSRQFVTKRIKITKTGTMLHRKPNQNHFNAKASRRAQLQHKGMTTVQKSTGKKIKQFAQRTP